MQNIVVQDTTRTSCTDESFQGSVLVTTYIFQLNMDESNANLNCVLTLVYIYCSKYLQSMFQVTFEFVDSYGDVYLLFSKVADAIAVDADTK